MTHSIITARNGTLLFSLSPQQCSRKGIGIGIITEKNIYSKIKTAFCTAAISGWL